MKNKGILITSIFLLVTIGNYLATYHDERVKSVEFVSIFAIIAISGILILQIVKRLKQNKK